MLFIDSVILRCLVCMKFYVKVSISLIYFYFICLPFSMLPCLKFIQLFKYLQFFFFVMMEWYLILFLVLVVPKKKQKTMGNIINWSPFTNLGKGDNSNIYLRPKEKLLNGILFLHLNLVKKKIERENTHCFYDK